jgi:hypothetical protein
MGKLVGWEQVGGSGQMTEVGALFDLVTDWGYDDW